MASTVSSLGSAVYVRYKDHVLFKNLEQPIEKAIERETIGWLSKENSEIILVEHDRTTPNTELRGSRINGLVILKNCITEIRSLPLQKSSEYNLNSMAPTVEGEYALESNKRKTPKTRRGANK
jgi:hypothetical protein